MKKLDSTHDLTKGEKSYLKEQNLSPEQFDKLDVVSQHEWKDELNNPHYDTMRNAEKKRGRKVWGGVPRNPN